MERFEGEDEREKFVEHAKMLDWSKVHASSLFAPISRTRHAYTRALCVKTFDHT